MEPIREVYKNIIEESHYMETVQNVVEKEIQEVLKGDRERLSQQEYEAYRGKVYEILAAAEEESFIAGFRYGVKLFAELME